MPIGFVLGAASECFAFYFPLSTFHFQPEWNRKGAKVAKGREGRFWVGAKRGDAEGAELGAGREGDF